jgi:glutamate formiminotransferase/formiminotetrahydrofolate cyclodeaminase
MTTKMRILECVPNFSEGRDDQVIRKIVDSIDSIKHVKVLHVDMGYAANRTVISFAGEPQAVIDAAFKAVQVASELIDMSKHTGVHPRLGATDVLPLIPISDISMDETVQLSYKLADRIGAELDIPVYCYEKSALKVGREKLEAIRKGEYEGLPLKLMDPLWEPDFGHQAMNYKSGATILGARNFLVAYNITLDSISVEVAKAIAATVRESGRTYVDDNGIKVTEPGLLPSVKAIGWYIDEYNKVQVSMNITDLEQTAVHTAYETVKKVAATYNTTILGSELIGLIPLKSLLAAGDYYVRRKFNLNDLTDTELIRLAIRKLGLEHLKPFNPEERIIEYLLG